MSKKVSKIVAGALTVTMILSLAAVSVTAEPYREQRITNTRVSYIEAVWFDSGIGHESSPDTGEHAVRPNEATQTQAGSSGFAGNIGWVTSGEWVQYTVTVEEADTYRVYAYLGSESNPAGNVILHIDDVEVGRTEGVRSEGWQNYDWYFIAEVDLTPGTIVLRTNFTGGVNFAALRFTTEAGILGEIVAGAATAAERAATLAAESREIADEAQEAAAAAPGTAAVMRAEEAETAARDAERYAERAAQYAAEAAAAGDAEAASAARDAAQQASSAASAARSAASTARNHANRYAREFVEAQGEAAGDAAAGDGAAETGGAAPAVGGGNGDGSMILWIILAVAGVAVIVVIVILVTKRKKSA